MIIYDEAKKKIDDYFNHVKPRQLDKALVRAGMDFYKEDEPREEVREKKKHKNHKGRDDR